jgi:hypothetical protein
MRAGLWIDPACGACPALAQPDAPLHNKAALGFEDLGRRLN